MAQDNSTVTKWRWRTGRLHGWGEHPEYSCWNNMKHRCLKPHARDYRNYGGRGITICQRWLDSFIWFLVDMGPKPGPGYSIDRIDNDGNYEPGNCKWSTNREQQRNTRANRLITINGETRCVAEWAELSGVSTAILLRRLRRNCPLDRLLMPQV